MQDFKYFTYGYPPESNPSYALYHPVLGVFLIVLPTAGPVMIELMAILSSKYLLQPVCVSTAENFIHNIIDNIVCEQWTLSNTQDLDSMGLLTHAGTKIISAKKLKSATPTVHWDIDREKRWAMMCWFWLNFLDYFRRWPPQTGSWIESALKDTLEITELGMANDPDQQQMQYLTVSINQNLQIDETNLLQTVKQFSQKTRHLLYLGKYLEQTDQEILALVNNNEFLHQSWMNFKKEGTI